MTLARARADDARWDHNPAAVLALFSGGSDSSVMLHVIRDLVDAVLFLDTGTGIPQTREFVRATCAEYGLKLIEQAPPDKTYEEIVLEYGFPGPAAHLETYVWLKERGIHAVRRRLQRFRGDRIVLLTGVRLAESSRRMGHVKPVVRKNSLVWVAPILDWTDADMNAYRKQYGVKRSEVADNLHMSGECLCGAFAQPGELEQIRFFYPEVAARIRALEAKVAATGNRACVWGVRPPGEDHQDEHLAGMLCSSCARRSEAMA